MHALKKAGTALLILAISLAIGEVALRIANRVSPSYVIRDDSYNRFRGKPGSGIYGFPVNSRGCLDTEFSEPSSGSFRVVALGDSFAFGVVPYPDNYLTLLEADLAQAGVRAEVFNMGTPPPRPPTTSTCSSTRASPSSRTSSWSRSTSATT